MHFLYPGILWGLLSIAIPVIIHLFYFRRFKKVYFTNVKFLKEIKEETSSRNKLKNLLILAMRCLALAALVFAFAQPFIPTTAEIKTGTKSVSIFVDNSFSMRAEKSNIPLLDLAKERAARLVNAYGEDTRFQIITNDLEGRHQRLVSGEEALSLIDEITASPSSQPLKKIINRQKQVLKGDHMIIFLISDFQKSVTDIGSWQDSLVELNLLPVQHSIQKNVSIDSVWFAAPVPILGQSNQLVVKYTNHSDDVAEEIKAAIWKDGMEKPAGNININPRSSTLDTIPLNILKAGIHEAELRIVDYPVQFDDRLFLSFNVKEKVKVLSINQGQPDRYLQAMFGGIDYFKFDNQDLGQIKFQQFRDYDLILLNDLRTITTGLANELQKYLESGGKVLLLPAKDADIQAYNAMLLQCKTRRIDKWDNKPREVALINTADFVFSDVYTSVGPNLKLPATKAGYLFSPALVGSGLSLLTYRDGQTFLFKNGVGEGQLFVCAAPLSTNYNNLVTQAEVFVPMLYKMALSRSKPGRLSYFIGKDNLIEAENKKTNGETVYKLKGKTEFIPGQNSFGKKVILDIKNQILNDGYYDLVLQDSIQDRFAFNYDRGESNLDLYDTDELEEMVKNDAVHILNYEGQEGIQEFVGEKDRGIVLWKWFIFAALMFLLAEILIIRYVKN
ncbi:MAG: BatA and WFA domain-containing protein [Saprospiraceae bacterium]|nr:BatA and WFA domain-containing protein [Saprospiraceae bacterium]